MRWINDNQKRHDHSYAFLFWWAIVTVIVVPVFLMVLGLASYHTGLALNNLTTLDGMSGHSQRVPCIPESVYEKKGIYNVKIC